MPLKKRYVYIPLLETLEDRNAAGHALWDALWTQSALADLQPSAEPGLTSSLLHHKSHFTQPWHVVSLKRVMSAPNTAENETRRVGLNEGPSIRPKAPSVQDGLKEVSQSLKRKLDRPVVRTPLLSSGAGSLPSAPSLPSGTLWKQGGLLHDLPFLSKGATNGGDDVPFQRPGGMAMRSFEMGGNTPPQAYDDNYTILHDTELMVDVEHGLLANDIDLDDDELKTFLVNGPAHGQMVFKTYTGVDAYGSFYYVPDFAFVGLDSFTYRVTDGYSEAFATVFINVTNTAPVGQADSYSLDEDTVLQIQVDVEEPPYGVLHNDQDADDDPLTAVLASSPTHGSLVFQDNGSFTYTPEPNYVGGDSFTYTITDGVEPTDPIPVTITVNGPAYKIDVDGHDATTLKPWMHEWEETSYNLQASTLDISQILVHETRFPEVISRFLQWDPQTLAIAGITQPGYLTLPLHGDQTLSVQAVRAGFVTSVITYGGTAIDPASGLQLTWMKLFHVVEEKAVLNKLEFLSDHNLLRHNTTNLLASGDRYQDIEWDRLTQYNAPITHTFDSKIKVKLTVDTAGLNPNAAIRIAGHNETVPALRFDSGVITPTGGVMTLELEGTTPLPRDIVKIKGDIAWTLIIDPNAQAPKSLPLGKTGEHLVYTLFGEPKLRPNLGNLHPTDIRMDLVVAHVGTAYREAQWYALFGEPTPYRVVNQIVKLHTFNAFRSPMYERGRGEVERLWLVPKTWTTLPPDNNRITPRGHVGYKLGSDCLSGAYYTAAIANMAGIKGYIDAFKYCSKSEAQPTTAIIGEVNIRDANNIPAYLWSRGQIPMQNWYEAAVYHDEGKVVLFPGSGGDRYFDVQEKVLSVFSMVAFQDGVYPFNHVYRGTPKPDLTRQPIHVWPNVAANTTID